MGARMEKSNRRIALIGFAILMVGLGISDSLRGIFSGIFQTHFALTAKGLSTIIAVSYAGNLCFLLAGGRIMDKIDRKKAFLGFLAVWMCAMLVFLLTDNYYALLVEYVHYTDHTVHFCHITGHDRQCIVLHARVRYQWRTESDRKSG